jgi:hypothetical protein
VFEYRNCFQGSEACLSLSGMSRAVCSQHRQFFLEAHRKVSQDANHYGEGAQQSQLTVSTVDAAFKSSNSASWLEGTRPALTQDHHIH